jgi:hypothetical protein
MYCSVIMSSPFETVSLRVPVRYLKDFYAFSVGSGSKSFLSRSPAAANNIRGNVDVFKPKNEFQSILFLINHGIVCSLKY